MAELPSTHPVPWALAEIPTGFYHSARRCSANAGLCWVWVLQHSALITPREHQARLLRANASEMGILLRTRLYQKHFNPIKPNYTGFDLIEGPLRKIKFYESNSKRSPSFALASWSAAAATPLFRLERELLSAFKLAKR